ncbi:conserved hypothetical protein [Desulfamplus magnetovallimortis]|uniref:Uncharacterized protein n=1 Tax=Desulfamplus magnetovallimortis TaxID=1246637 RepID=A0A1W1HD87_9BACT|nr:hypothetical protein [Desulfamplus magnetovallimortis]SLM30454.1 conserved hypothetical protein [Desulfamplus magnetovallimortis]
MEKLEQFIEEWNENDSETKKAFIEIMEHLKAMEGIKLDFIARPGVSYSLRPRHPGQEKRPLFAMADVIDDDPEARWLSVCFYEDMITDPDEMGDLIPGGLLGSDGYCFDLDEYDAEGVIYLKDRLTEAYKRASE